MTARSDDATTELFRPVGAAELELIAASGFCAFPPRLPEQPRFYPVLSFGYAATIARDWNARGAAGSGYVTRFHVATDSLSRYDVQRAGSRDHLEYWIPANELAAFNDAIRGGIEIVAEYRRDGGTMRALRMMDGDDVDYVSRLIASPHMHDHVVTTPRERIEASLEEESRRSFIIERDGTRRGIAMLKDVGSRSRTLYLALLAVAEPGRGDGSWALRRTIARAFETHGAHRLWLEVVAGNSGARRLYERHGFVIEGTWRDGFFDRHGNYRDLCAYGLLEDEYRAISRSSSSPV